MKKTFIQHISDATSRHAWARLTPDLLEKARHRVKALAWLMTGVMVLGAAADFSAIALAHGRIAVEWIWYGAIGIAASGVLLYMAYDRRIKHSTVLYTTLAYEVTVCFLLALLTTQILYQETGQLPLITWVTPFIILFPLIVPSPPRITLAVALLAAATRPAALYLFDLRPGVVVEPMFYYTAIGSPLFAVAMAYVGSRVVHGMHVDLANAQRMGSYTLETLLGTGGMGEVWRARHQLLARPAAVKLVRAEHLAANDSNQEVALARFEREAQVTAAMRSPHTVQLYDFGIAQTGVFYYVMELLNGLDLDDLVTRFGPLRPSRAIHFLRQIADSLGEAHERGLIHRDIKPGNIYVCKYGRVVDFVKVLDFGLVKAPRQEQDVDLQLTAQNMVAGTPAFIAPEQALGDEVDARTDIYQLGCVAYWMLTGTYVFRGDSAMQTMMMHVEKAPEPPSLHTEQAIPEDLDALVLRCLAKKPADRPQSVDALAELLIQCRVGEAWTPEQGSAWWERYLPDRLVREEAPLAC
jgi:tRNA A-37 threonylcarbamoyl transferase component Bud32